MREVLPTRGALMELSDERRLMRQGYEFLDEKRILLANEILRQLRDYQQQFALLIAATERASSALAAAVERHGFDQLQVYPAAEPPALARPVRTTFLGLPMLSSGPAADSGAPGRAALDPSPEAKACQAEFARLVRISADIGLRVANLMRLAREYRRTERRAEALEKVLLPETEEAIKRLDEQLDTMEREEVIRSRWSSPQASIKAG